MTIASIQTASLMFIQYPFSPGCQQISRIVYKNITEKRRRIQKDTAA